MSTTIYMVPFVPVVRAVATVFAIAALGLFFKPLLVGIARALVLMVNPRLPKAERRARQQMRDAEIVRRTMNGADLRELVSRGCLP